MEDRVKGVCAHNGPQEDDGVTGDVVPAYREALSPIVGTILGFGASVRDYIFWRHRAKGTATRQTPLVKGKIPLPQSPDWSIR